MNAYKIKSVVLERNPKEEVYEKSKKFMRKLLERRNSINKIESSRAQSEQPFDASQLISVESSRINTEYKNRNTFNLRLPSPSIKNSRKSVRIDSFFHNINDDVQ